MNPILVDVLRGDAVESVHRGAVHVVDDAGQVLLSVGDVDKLVFPRSAIKIMQALPLVESGAAAALGLNDKQLSLACSSHNGEVGHTEVAQSILAASGLGVGDLQCGVHMPFHNKSAYELVKTGERACALHNNCSGKHSGMLAFAKHVGFDTQDYIDIEHPVQLEMAKVMSELTETNLNEAPWGFDGCSLPTWAAPLTAWAMAFAKISRGKGLGEVRGNAFAKLRDAVMAEPFYVAGTGRYCTQIMSELSTPIFVKTGAEGVFCVSLPEHGIGIALKCDDGTLMDGANSCRGSEMMLSATLKKLGVLKPEDDDVIARFTNRVQKNCNGYEVATVRPAEYWGF